jgi:RNA polymerase sigma-70 factor (ECF subfamily)
MAYPQPHGRAEVDSDDDGGATQDEHAVARVLRGDTDAYAELVARHMRRAFAIAYRIVEQREDAEDAVQDSFIRALERLATLQPGRPFRPWFYRIVVTQALNLRRSRRVRQTESLPEQSASRLPTPEQHTERVQLRGRLLSALDGLSETQRTAVILAELVGLTSAEIATVLDISAGTVRWHLHQARRTLRETLEPLMEEK